MENLRPILSGLIGAMVSTALLVWAMRGPAEHLREGHIYYSKRMRVLACILLALGLFIGYAALHASPDQRFLAYPMGAVGFLSGIWLVLETFFVRARISPTYLLIWSPWRGHRSIPWSAITGYEYSETMMWHVLTTEGFGKVRLSCYLSGVDQIADHLSGGKLILPRPRR